MFSKVLQVVVDQYSTLTAYFSAGFGHATEYLSNSLTIGFRHLSRGSKHVLGQSVDVAETLSRQISKGSEIASGYLWNACKCLAQYSTNESKLAFQYLKQFSNSLYQQVQYSSNSLGNVVRSYYHDLFNWYTPKTTFLCFSLSLISFDFPYGFFLFLFLCVQFSVSINDIHAMYHRNLWLDILCLFDWDYTFWYLKRWLMVWVIDTSMHRTSSSFSMSFSCLIWFLQINHPRTMTSVQPAIK